MANNISFAVTCLKLHYKRLLKNREEIFKYSIYVIRKHKYYYEKYTRFTPASIYECFKTSK